MLGEQTNGARTHMENLLAGFIAGILFAVVAIDFQRKRPH